MMIKFILLLLLALHSNHAYTYTCTLRSLGVCVSFYGQLKYARQETSLLLGHKQSVEAQAQACALELQHLKSALDVSEAQAQARAMELQHLKSALDVSSSFIICQTCTMVLYA